MRVPIQTQVRSALVINQMAEKPKNIAFAIKQALAIEPFPADPHYFNFVQQLSSYYQVEPLHFIKRVQQFLMEKELADDVVLPVGTISSRILTSSLPTNNKRLLTPYHLT